MASSIKDVQKIVVTLSTHDVVIEPGSVAQVVVNMINRQENTDRLFVEVEGVDVEWYAIPVPAVNVAAGAEETTRINFRVARNSENRAGSYPFLVRVQAMETGEIGVAQATLIVKPFSWLQVELNPRRAMATFFHPLNDFDVTIANLGNRDETLDLYANDPDDGCAYEFDTDRITLKPGQSEAVPLAVRPKVSSVLGGTRLYGFTVSARSMNDSYVAANVHGQVEKRALISPLFGLILLLLGLGGMVYWVNRPQPPVALKINSFTIAPSRIEPGQPAEASLSWDVRPGYKQILIFSRIGKNGTDMADPGVVQGEAGRVGVKPQYPLTLYTLVVRGGSGQKELTKQVAIEVPKPPLPLKPAIRWLAAEPQTIHLGESLYLKWEGRAKQYIIDPGNISLSPLTTTYQVTPTADTVYTLRALGDDSSAKPASQTVSVSVRPRDVSIAEIKKFAVQNKIVYIGDKARLVWKSRFATRVRIDASRGDPIGDVTPPSGGTIEVTVSEPTDFTLTATDSAGQTKTSKITVIPQVKPPPPQPPSPDPNAVPSPVTPP